MWKNLITRQTIWKLLLTLLAVLLVLFIFDLQHVVVNFVRQSAYSAYIAAREERPKLETYSPWEYILESEEDRLPVSELNLTFYISRAGVDANYEIVLPREHPLFVAIQQGQGESFSQTLIEELLGSISISNQKISFGAPEFSVKEGDANGYIWLDGSITHTSPRYTVVIEPPTLQQKIDFEKNQITVYPEIGNVYAGYDTPVSQTITETRFIRDSGPILDPYYFGISYVDQTESPISNIQNLSGIFRMIGTARLPWVHYLLIALLEASPLILLFFFQNRGVDLFSSPGASHFLKVVKGLLVVHFSYYGLSFINSVYQASLQPLMRLDLWFSEWFPFGRPSFGLSSLALVLLAAALYWPLLLRRSLRPEEEASSSASVRERLFHLGQILLAGFIAALPLALILWRAESYSGILDPGASLFEYGFLPVELDVYLPWISVGWIGFFFFLSYWSCLWLWSLLVGRHGLVRKALFSSLLLLFISVSISIWPTTLNIDELSPVGYALCLVYFLVFGTRLVFYFGSMFFQAWSEIDFETYWRDQSRLRKLAVILLAMFLAFPTTWISQRSQYLAAWDDIYSLLTVLDNLILFAFLFFLLRRFKEIAQNSTAFQLTPTMKVAGILYALAFFYSPTSYWLYIPIPALVGYFLLNRWLVSSPETGDSVVLAQNVTAKRKELIAGIIEVNRAERAMREARKGFLSKLSKGELKDYEEYEGKLAPFQASITKLEGKLKEIQGSETPAKNLILDFGPSTSPWQNGLTCALYGLLFSIPWLASYLRNQLLGLIPGSDHLFLYLASTIFLVILKWVLYGFFFGYFYPFIRGRNGLEKGFWFFLMLVIPQLALTALLDPTNASNWQSYLIWAAQIFIHCMLLGLIAGDFRTLRGEGYNWQHLWEVHNLGSLSAWGSSILLAVGASLAALLSQNISELLFQGLKYFGLTFISGPGS